jgi:hypothetical protein
MFLSTHRVFCWTKIQAESGEDLARILRRKDLERRAGGGVFFWGVGNSLGKKTHAVLSGHAHKVAFSRMRSRPKREDVAPTGVLLWQSYIDYEGQAYPLPPHVLITSRADTMRSRKRRHYALVCRSGEALSLCNHGWLNLDGYKNFESRNPRVGASQVTTVLEQKDSAAIIHDANNRYQINMVADLADPHFVMLATPVALLPDELAALANISKIRSVSMYRTEAKRIRNLAAQRTPGSTPLQECFYLHPK